MVGAPTLSRRDFFRGLKSSSNMEPAKAGLQFRKSHFAAERSDGVLWSISAFDAQRVYAAGDDGRIFRFDGQAWQIDKFGTDLPIHQIDCSAQNLVIAIGWLGSDL